MDRKRKLLAGAALAALPFVSHAYIATETRAVQAYRRTRAMATVWMLEKLQRPYDLRLLVELEAQAKGVQSNLAMALVEQESGWNVTAIRREEKLKTASYGLFQILPETARDCPGRPSASDLLHPVTNVRCGMHLLSKYLTKTKNTRRALVAYNGGERCLSSRCPQAEEYAMQVLARL